MIGGEKMASLIGIYTKTSWVVECTLSVLKCRSFQDFFSTDYGDGENTLISLIIKYWDSIWVTKYVLIKVAYFFSCTSSTSTSPYMAACTSFYWKRLENDA